MKKLLLSLTLIFILNGCALETFIEKQVAKHELKDLCDNSSNLAICWERKIPDYNGAQFDDLSALNNSTIFEYEADGILEDYDYLTGPIHKGDCDDWVVTFIEDNLRAGNLQRNSVEWIFGEYKNEGHSWVLVTINNETYLFDNMKTRGIEFTIAYSKLNYKEKFIVYKY